VIYFLGDLHQPPRINKFNVWIFICQLKKEKKDRSDLPILRLKVVGFLKFSLYFTKIINNAWSKLHKTEILCQEGIDKFYMRRL